MEEQTQAHCSNFSIIVVVLTAPRMNDLRVPQAHCAHCIATAEPLHAWEPAIEYSPDGKAALCQTCTPLRWDTQCKSAINTPERQETDAENLQGNSGVQGEAFFKEQLARLKAQTFDLQQQCEAVCYTAALLRHEGQERRRDKHRAALISYERGSKIST